MLRSSSNQIISWAKVAIQSMPLIAAIPHRRLGGCGNMESGRVGGPGASSHSLFFGGAGWENGPAEARTTRRWAQLAAGGMSIGWTRGEVGTEHAEEAQGDEPLAKRVSRQNSQTMKIGRASCRE